jgi:hypothetical protein
MPDLVGGPGPVRAAASFPETSPLTNICRSSSCTQESSIRLKDRSKVCPPVSLLPAILRPRVWRRAICGRPLDGVRGTGVSDHDRWHVRYGHSPTGNLDNVPYLLSLWSPNPTRHSGTTRIRSGQWLVLSPMFCPVMCRSLQPFHSTMKSLHRK